MWWTCKWNWKLLFYLQYRIVEYLYFFGFIQQSTCSGVNLLIQTEMKYLVIQEIPKLKCFAGLQPEVFVQPLLLKKDRFALALVSACPGPEH